VQKNEPGFRKMFTDALTPHDLFGIFVISEKPDTAL